MEQQIVKVGGMTCNGCAASVEKALLRVAGVDEVKADHVCGEVRVSGANLAARLPALRAAVENAGFDWLG